MKKQTIILDSECAFVANALEAAAEQYLKDAETQLRAGDSALHQHFRMQSLKAKQLAERIQAAGY